MRTAAAGFCTERGWFRAFKHLTGLCLDQASAGLIVTLWMPRTKPVFQLTCRKTIC